MQSIQDSALIINKKNFGEADVLVTLLTKNHGKIRALAKGARKSTSRLVGHIELFSYINGAINFRSSIPILSQVTLERSVEGLAEDRVLLQRISLLAEITDKSLEEGLAMEAVSDLLTEGIELLRQNYEPMLFIGIMIRLLGLLGYAPELSTCVICRKQITIHDQYGWDSSSGGVVTNDCRTKAFQLQMLSQESLKALRYLQKHPLAQMGKLQAENNIEEELTQLLVQYGRYVLEKPLISANVTYQASITIPSI